MLHCYTLHIFIVTLYQPQYISSSLCMSSIFENINYNMGVELDFILYFFMILMYIHREIISVADPVHFFRIRIRGSGFKIPDTDPDPGDPKTTGSDRIRIRILLRYVFDV